MAELQDLADHAVRHYRPFPKRKGRKVRWIDNPDSELKRVQKRIKTVLLETIEFPEYVQGSVKGRSSTTNASLHLASKVVVCLDIRSFFPSVSNRQVYDVWSKTLGSSPKVASLLTALTTYRGRLPQGAPTSSYLANLVLLETDRNIAEKATATNCKYSRYVDDIVLSGENPQQLIPYVIGLLRDWGFRIARDKLTIAYSSEPQEITGMLVNSPRGPSVSRKKRDQVKAAIAELRAIRGERQRDRAICQVQGRVAFVGSANPGSGRSLRRKLARVLGEMEEQRA